MQPRGADPTAEIERILYGLISLALSFFTMALLPFLRYRFGERYLNLSGMYFVVLVVLALITGNLFAGAFGGGGGGLTRNIFGFYLLAFILLGLTHNIQIFRRNRRGDPPVHSYSRGQSHLWNVLPVTTQFTVSEHIVQRFIEPILTLTLGVALAIWVDELFGIFITIMAVALLVREQIEYQLLRHRILDAIDAAIDGEALNQIVAGRLSPRDNQGSPLPIGVPASMRRPDRQGIARQLGGLFGLTSPGDEAPAESEEPAPENPAGDNANETK